MNKRAKEILVSAHEMLDQAQWVMGQVYFSKPNHHDVERLKKRYKEYLKAKSKDDHRTLRDLELVIEKVINIAEISNEIKDEFISELYKETLSHYYAIKRIVADQGWIKD